MPIRPLTHMALALTGLLIMGDLSGPRTALAHAKLIRSRPNTFEVLDAGASHVQLWFNERLEDEFNSIEVTDSAGQRVEDGQARVDPQDRTTVLVRLMTLAPGSYLVRWKILSVDGHTSRGRFIFSVK